MSADTRVGAPAGSPPGYARGTVLLHWASALLIVSAFALGLLMVPMPFSPSKLKYYAWHKWLGVTVFLVAWVRLALRLRFPAPPPLGSASSRRWARVGHGLLYGLMIVTPLTGWLYSSAAGVQTVYLGWLPLPDLVGRDAGLKTPLKIAHLVAIGALCVLVVGHAIAALVHHVVLRDDTLRRMLRI